MDHGIDRKGRDREGPKILGIDVDGTIWSCYDRAFDELERLTGDRWAMGDFTSYDLIHETYGAEIGNAIFRHAVHPSYCPERVPYPGAREAIKVMGALGIRARFITTNAEPDAIKGPLERWLNRLFPGCPVDVLPPSEPKIERLLDVGCVGIVDDRPDTLEDVANAGLLAATIRQPWNESFLEGRSSIIQFDSWIDVLSDGALITEVLRARP